MRDTATQTIDSKLKERLAANDYHRYSRSRKGSHCSTRSANASSAEKTHLFLSAITAPDLAGARSISAVLHARLAQVEKPWGRPTTWTQRTPGNAPQLAREAATAIDNRINALGIRHAEKPEPWLTSQLGAFPISGSALEQQDYLRRAGSAAAYREAVGIDDPHQAVSPTPHKGDPVREQMRKDAITHLEIQTEEEIYRTMSRGELEAKERQAQRAYAAGPKGVAAELKDTALAEADQRQAAAEAKAHSDDAAARALRSLADLLETRKSALEADHAKHENWSAETAALRHEGSKARAELTRRGQATEPAPGGSTLEWWQRSERDCQAFEKHLVHLEAQAETESQSWPPQPTAKAEAPDEAKQNSKLAPNMDWGAELVEEPSYEPEPEMPEATA